MSQRATRRLRAFRKPDYWDSAPPPQAQQVANTRDEEFGPTRYGDWVRKGIAVDF